MGKAAFSCDLSFVNEILLNIGMFFIYIFKIFKGGNINYGFSCAGQDFVLSSLFIRYLCN